MKARILVVDDDPGMRKSLAMMLRREGYDISEAVSGKEALDQLGKDVYELVIADLRMESLSGLDLLRRIKETSREMEVMLMTAYGTVETAVEAMKLGAFDFITKPFQPEEILLRIRNALEKHGLERELARLRSEIRKAFGVEGIIGVSDGMRKVLELVTKIAPIDSTVLVTGESGTGKELIARAIHAASRRSRRPFVSVSCAAVPEQLLENELFGHVKGAFTGAIAARTGLLEEASGGTFFLDEIGEASPAIQAKLLRVMEDRTVRRLGDNRNIPVDIRFIAATNRDLESAVNEKTFREDLYYRLNVIHLHCPPLRERREDIPLLAKYFLVTRGERLGRKLEGLSPEALELLTKYDFPGNVRELSNSIEHAAALATGPLIEASNLPRKILSRLDERSVPDAAVNNRDLAAAEREMIIERLRARGGNLGLAAKDLGISRTTLWRRMKEYKIEFSRFSESP